MNQVELMTALTKINQKLLEHIQIISQIVADIPTMAPYEADLTAIEQELQQLLSTNTVGGKRRRRRKSQSCENKEGRRRQKSYRRSRRSQKREGSKNTSTDCRRSA